MAFDYQQHNANDFIRLPGSSRRYALASDPTITISRTQFDVQYGRLKKQGFKSPAEQAKVNRERRIVGAHNVTQSRLFITFHFRTLEDAITYFEYLSPEKWGYIVLHGVKTGASDQAVEAGWLTVQELVTRPSFDRDTVETNAMRLFSFHDLASVSVMK